MRLNVSETSLQVKLSDMWHHPVIIEVQIFHLLSKEVPLYVLSPLTVITPFQKIKLSNQKSHHTVTFREHPFLMNLKTVFQAPDKIIVD